MVFQSMLTGFPDNKSELKVGEPKHFADLNLDQIVNGIAKRYERYNVKDLLMAPLSKLDDIKYRQQVFSDLESKEILDAVRGFSECMKIILVKISSLPDTFDIQREGRLLVAAKDYSISIRRLFDSLKMNNVKSTAFKEFIKYLEDYLSSMKFMKLEKDIDETERRIKSIRYHLVIGSDRVTVRKSDTNTLDYSFEVENVFSKFEEAHHETKSLTSRAGQGIGHVQAEILKLIEKLYPDEIKKLREFSAIHSNFIENTIMKVFQELQFYLAYLEYVEGPKNVGLPFCIPEFTESNAIEVNSGFDLALAVKLVKNKGTVITNDFHLEGVERIVVVTGPNNGGKTTFARSVGQSFYLATLGVPIPGRKATLTLQDNIFTHFERIENVENLRGRLEDDLIRIKDIVDNCTNHSVVIINEMLSSTTVNDATSIGTKVIDLIKAKNCLCIFVTFLDDFSRLEGVVSLVAQVSAENPEIRTYKIVRQPSNGLAYALALAHKHKLSYDDIRGRISND